MADLHGKCAVVTGSSRGIGAEIARAYAKSGARLVVTSRHKKDCDAVVDEIKNLGGEAIAVECDVSDEGQVKNLINEAADNYGSVEILVNNAGVFDQKPIDQMDIELWKKIRSVDLDGVFFATKYAAEKMKKVKWGRIINISSVAGIDGFAASAAYCAAKFGVIGFTKAAAVDLAPYGITVNAICPGLIETQMTEKFTTDKETLERMTSSLLVRRAGIPQDIAAAALYLVSDDANYVTGTSLVVDGGWSCHL